MTRFPSLDLLRTFSLAASYLNISRTADELCLTQSAVSRQLKLLEEQLQAQLFIRTNRGLSLTDVGQQLFRQIQPIMAQIVQAIGTVMPAQKKLVLSVDAAFAHNWLMKRLPLFRELNPGIELELILTQAFAVQTGCQLLAGCDAYIVFGQPPWPGFRAEALLTLYEFPVCSPALLQGGTAMKEPRDLLKQNLIHEVDRTTWRTWLDAAGAGGEEGLFATVVHDSLICVSLAVDGQGIAIGDNLVCADYLASGALVRPFAQQVRLEETFYLALGEEKLNANINQAFRSWLRELLPA
jgi:LysR family glycine cleavage system transcriptional activator